MDWRDFFQSDVLKAKRKKKVCIYLLTYGYTWVYPVAYFE